MRHCTLWGTNTFVHAVYYQLLIMATKGDIKFRGSKIWNHYKRSICGKLAECKTCRKVLKCEGVSGAG